MTIEAEARKAIPVTCFTGFLGMIPQIVTPVPEEPHEGKTTTILGLLKQLPKEYKVVLLKNEYGDVEVDSLLASQSNITGVSEILNGCLCCTMVGLVENAMIEVRDKFSPDRIIIESSGSAFPATLALQIRQLEPEGFKLDGVVTVIDCVNFTGYEDTSPSAKLQAKYTDLLLLNKHHLLTENQLDILQDHLGVLNDETPRIKISQEQPISPEVVFGIDTRLWGLDEQTSEKEVFAGMGGGEGWHGDEVEVKTVWRGGRRPGSEGKKRKRGDGEAERDGVACGHQHDHSTNGDSGAKAEGITTNGHTSACDCHDAEGEEEEDLPSTEGEKAPGMERTQLESELGKLSFEIYRVKGIVRLLPPQPSTASPSAEQTSLQTSTYILNYAFGRHELTPVPSLDKDPSLAGVGLRLTFMGERGEVGMRARKFAAAFGAQVA